MFPAMLNTCNKMVEYLKGLPPKTDVNASDVRFFLYFDGGSDWLTYFFHNSISLHFCSQLKTRWNVGSVLTRTVSYQMWNRFSWKLGSRYLLTDPCGENSNWVCFQFYRSGRWTLSPFREWNLPIVIYERNIAKLASLMFESLRV